MIVHDKNTQRLIIFILTAVQFCHVLDFVIMMPLGPQLMRVLSINSSQFGALVSSYTISAGIFGFLGTFLTQRFERKHFMIIVNIGFIIGTALCSFAYNYETLMGARIIAGGFGGIFGATIFAMVGDYIPQERRGTAMGIVMAAFPISSVIGVPLGLMTANKFGWQSPFLYLAILSFLFLIMAVTTLPNVGNEKQNKNPFALIKDVLFQPGHFNAFWLMQIFMFSIFLLIPYIAPYNVKNVGVLESELPYIYLFGGAFTFFTSQILGRLTDRFGAFKILLIVGLLSFIPIILITNLPKVPLYQVIIVTCIFMSLISGRNVPAMTLMLSKVKISARGSFMTLASSFQQLAIGLASFVGGVILVESPEGKLLNYDKAGYLAITVSIIGLAIGYFLDKKPNPAE